MDIEITVVNVEPVEDDSTQCRVTLSMKSRMRQVSGTSTYVVLMSASQALPIGASIHLTLESVTSEIQHTPFDPFDPQTWLPASLLRDIE